MTKTDKEGQRKTPILRFKGFTDDWEQRQLRKLAKLITKGTTPQKYDGNINFIKVENIEEVSINPKAKILESEHLGKLKRSILKENDILFSIAGSLGKVGLVNSAILPANTNQALAIIRLSESKDIEYNYIFNYLRSNYIQHFIRRLPSVGAQPNLSLKQINELVIKFPNYCEQQKISNMLDRLNNILTLYERKLKLLSQVKKYFLDNLFTKKEYPNLRFKGFTDAWKQRKLLKICKKEDNKRIPIKEQERKEGNTPYFGANGIQGYIDGYTHDGTNILIAEDGANNVKNYPIKLITGKIWVNNHAHVLNVNTKINNGNFLVGAIKKINFYRYLVGSSRYKLTAESLNQVKIKIAKQSEQEKIGELLKNIEDLLTSYENKQQHLTEIKKTLLNTMFI